MKKIFKVAAAALSVLMIFCPVTSSVFAYNDGVHDTDRMTATPDFTFRFVDKDIMDTSQNTSYYNAADDTFYVMADVVPYEIIYTLAEDVTYEDVVSSFEEYKQETLTEENGYTKESKELFAILKGDDKIYSPDPGYGTYTVFARFAQDHSQLFESVEGKLFRKYMYKMGNQFFLDSTNIKKVKEYIDNNELDCECRKRSNDEEVVFPEYSLIDGYEESLVELVFPDDISTYARAEIAFSIAKSINANVVARKDSSAECTWTSTNMLDLTDYTTSPQLPQLEVSTFSEENSLPGDANCDNKITVADAVAVLQYIANAEKYPLSDQGKTNADIDCEDGITGGDARAIQRLDAGLSVSVEETIHYYSTAEELISLLVSKDENFSDHGLIYAPGYKFDAVLNGAGGDSNKVDYLIVYGIDPDDCMRYGNIQKMPDDIVLNNSEFARNGIPEFHCGKIESIGCCSDYKIRSKSGNFLWIVYFIDGITPGFMAKTTDEDWTEACGFSYMPYVFPDGADNN